MRVVFIGASKFGLRCLEEVTKLDGIELVGIITNPEVFSISYRPEGVKNVLHADFRPIAEEHSVPVHLMQGKMNNPALVEQVIEWAPDFILVVGWYHMVPKKIRDIAPTAGLHASLLPDYSGGAPLVWAMINGEEKTGITFFYFDKGIDSGPILGQKEEEIRDDDTIATLYARIEERGLELIREQLPLLRDGRESTRVQNESNRRTFPQRCPDDGQINWQNSSREIFNFIRAQTSPYPGAFARFDDKAITLWGAVLRQGRLDAAPGQLTKEGGCYHVRGNDDQEYLAIPAHMVEERT